MRRLTNGNRKISILGFEFFTAGIFLTAATIVMDYIGNLFTALDPKLNTYSVAMFSGVIGGLLEYGLSVAYDTQKV